MIAPDPVPSGEARTGHGSSPLSFEAVTGRARDAGPRPVLDRFTVLTRSTSRVVVWTRALRLAAFRYGLAGSPPPTLLPATRGGHDRSVRVRQRPAVLMRAASRRTGSVPALKAPCTLLRAGFIARPQPAVVEQRGSDALPIDGMGELWSGFFLRRAHGTVEAEKARGVKGLGCRDCAGST